MKKSILAILLVLAIQIPALADSYIDKQLKESKKNTKYSTMKKHTAKHDIAKKGTLNEIRDPKLITLSEIKPVDEAKYQAKIAKDNLIYESQIKKEIQKKLKTVNIQPADVDFYNVYRISERLIRANNLGYMNWRIAIRKSEDTVNAASTAANFIWVYTALYDTFYTNEDALAFVIAHEMAHHILGHSQRKMELAYRLSRLSIKSGAGYELADSVGELAAFAQKKRLLAESRKMEYMADIEGAILLTRAGYDMDKAMEALNFFNALPNVKTLNDTHPIPKKRIESMNENRQTFIDEWVNEGKNNIMNSNVLSCKKSSDRVSIVINKDPSTRKYYEPETLENKLTRIAYKSYKNGNFKDAIKYFEKLNDITENYANYLYISYANEYLYDETQNDKYLKAALENAKKANTLNAEDKYSAEQIENISTQLSSLQ